MAEYVRDDFARSVGSGLGSAVVGGSWTVAGGSSSVDPGGGGRALFPMAGTGPATVHARLGAATPARDVILTTAFRVTALDAVHTLRVLARVDAASVIGSPTADYAQIVIAPDGSATVSLGVLAAGVATECGTADLPAGSYVAGRMWRLELEAIGSELDDTATDLRVRVWDMEDPAPDPDVAIPPDQADGWLLAEMAVVASSGITYDGTDLVAAEDITPAGPQVAGVYQLTVGRDLASAGTALELGDVYVTDPLRPEFTYTLLDPATNTIRFVPADTGDPVDWSWDFADGSGAYVAGTVDHAYAELGYYTVTYTVTSRWGTLWYWSDGVLAATEPVGVSLLAAGGATAKQLLPIVTIDGTKRCEVYRASWARGSTFWTDGLVGNAATFDLRGRVGAVKGARVNVVLPDASGGKPLWRGYVDTVHYSLHPVEATDTTQITAYDVAAHLGRRHIHKGVNLGRHTLPYRVLELIPHRGIRFHGRYPDVVTEAGRYPWLRKQAYKRDKLRERTYLDMLRDALQASIAFAYCREDGTIVYGPWDAPASLPLVIRVDLDGDLDCPSGVETDRRSEGQVINRWTVGDGDKVDRTARESVDKYGEHAYTVATGVLAHEADFPLTNGFFHRMKSPHSAPVVVVPVRSAAQHALFADPMSIARWEGRIYAILGVQHAVERNTWNVTLTLDRNPWRIHGADVPELPDGPDPPATTPIDEFTRADPVGYGWGVADNGASWFTDFGPGDVYGDAYPMSVAGGVGRATTNAVSDDTVPRMAPTVLAYIPPDRPYNTLWRWRVVMDTARPHDSGFLLSLFGPEGSALLALWVSPTAPSGASLVNPGPGLVYRPTAGADFGLWRYSRIRVDDTGWRTRTWNDGDTEPSSWDSTVAWGVLPMPTSTRIALTGLDAFTGGGYGPTLDIDYIRTS